MKTDPTDIRAEIRRAEALEQDRRRKRIEDLADLQAVMATQAGRRFVWTQLERTGLFHEPFDNSGSVTAYNCGRQSLGRQLWLDLHSTDALIGLWRQAEQERAHDARPELDDE